MSVPCHRCHGAKTVEYVNGHVAPCPHCKGVGRLDPMSMLESPNDADVARLSAENARLNRWITELIEVVQAQAEDEGLWWYVNLTAPQAYLQQGLRELHELIEGERTAADVLAAIRERAP